MKGEFSTLRTELFHLLVIPFLAHHPVKANRQFSRHGHLGDFRPRRIVRWTYLLRHSGRLRTVTCAVSTSRKRNREFPCFVICPSRRRFPLESSIGTSPR